MEFNAMKYNTIEEIGFLRLPAVLKIFPVSKSTWWSGVKSGRYPKPVKLSENVTAWKIEDIKSLIAETSRTVRYDDK
jgi:predicted DNA-binding transcriptional regulator AlpA